MRRKEERSKQGQTNNKAKQHSTPKAVTFHVHVCACIADTINSLSCKKRIVMLCPCSMLQVMCGLECGHYFCRECWDSYLRVMVMCEGRGQSIQCPASHCAIVVDEVTVLQLLREPEVCTVAQQLSDTCTVFSQHALLSNIYTCTCSFSGYGIPLKATLDIT